MKTIYVPFGRLSELKYRKDADRIAYFPGVGVFDDYKVIIFPTRKHLENCLKRSTHGRPLIFTQVPKNCAVYAFQVENQNKGE